MSFEKTLVVWFAWREDFASQFDLHVTKLVPAADVDVMTYLLHTLM